TAGRAADYSDFPLPNGKILRVAVAEMIAPDGRSLFPEGVKPDLPVEMSTVDKRQIFQLSGEKGMAQFVYEAGRPHMNEAALLAGMNPEVEAAEAAQQRRGRAAEALTHPSLSHEAQRHHFDYQRLEFLGDAVLQLVITEYLFRNFHIEAEGQLTKLRSRLVSREALKMRAATLDLGRYILMGRGEEASGGRERTS